MFRFFKKKWSPSGLAAYLNSQWSDLEFTATDSEVAAFDNEGPYALLRLRDKGRRVEVVYVDDVMAHFAADLALRLDNIMPTSVRTDEVMEYSVPQQHSYMN